VQTTSLFQLSILTEPKAAVLAALRKLLQQPDAKTTIICTPNPEQIVMARHDQTFAKHLRQADYLLPDGIGLVWASRLLHFFGRAKQSISERIAGVEVVEALLREAETHKLTTLIIGGRDYQGSFEGEAFEDERSLKKLRPLLYWTEGYQDKAEILPVEELALEKIIKRLRPTLVFVALGAPDQERWLSEHRSLLEQSRVKIAMVVGGSFDFILGKVPRAPRLWQKFGFEWLWRLYQQPWRKRRQLRLLQFIALTFRELF